jgi:hypothetical protein
MKHLTRRKLQISYKKHLRLASEKKNISQLKKGA